MGAAWLGRVAQGLTGCRQGVGRGPTHSQAQPGQDRVQPSQRPWAPVPHWLWAGDFPQVLAVRASPSCQLASAELVTERTGEREEGMAGGAGVSQPAGERGRQQGGAMAFSSNISHFG